LIKDTFEQQTFYGPVKPEQLGRALVAEFNHGNFRARMLGRGKQRVVQIATREAPRSGGRTAITVHLVEHDDGIHVRIGQQDWLGVAASLGWTALAALRQPMSLLGRLDDLAQDLASLQLTARIWQTLSAATESLGLSPTRSANRIAWPAALRWEISSPAPAQRADTLWIPICGIARSAAERSPKPNPFCAHQIKSPPPQLRRAYESCALQALGACRFHHLAAASPPALERLQVPFQQIPAVFGNVLAQRLPNLLDS